MSLLNYDHVASDYHRRYDQNPMPGVAQALDELADVRAATRILEVGCGTGRWLEALARPARWLTGLDPSREMLNQARMRLPAIPLLQAAGEHLPLATASFDLVFMVNVLHHLSDPARFFENAHRVLAPDGVVAVVGADPAAPDNAWYIYDYFDGVRELDEARFPNWGQVQRWMAEAGFGPITKSVVHVVDVTFVGDEVFSDAFLAKKATSQLAMLSEDAYQAGIERIRAAIDAHPCITFHTHVEMVMMVGTAKREAGQSASLDTSAGPDGVL